MNLPDKPRFIAGAVCPRCGEMDRIMAHRDENRSIRRCVACGFAESKEFLLAERELPTRVSRGKENSPYASSAAQPVKILPANNTDESKDEY